MYISLEGLQNKIAKNPLFLHSTLLESDGDGDDGALLEALGGHLEQVAGHVGAAHRGGAVLHEVAQAGLDLRVWFGKKRTQTFSDELIEKFIPYN